MNINKILFGVILFVGVILFIFIYTSLQDMEEIKTKCYDRHSNEIEGLSCTEEQYSIHGVVIPNEVHTFIAIGIILFIFLSMFAIFIGATEKHDALSQKTEVKKE